jgi:hypothetical protein
MSIQNHKQRGKILAILFAFFLCLPITSIFSASLPGPITNLTVYAEPTLPVLPAAGGTFVDPTFGSTIMRLTDATDGTECHNAYSYWPTFNKDNTRFFLYSSKGIVLGTFDPLGFKLLSKQLFTKTTPAGTMLNFEDLMWSNVDPDILLGRDTVRLWSYNVRTTQFALLGNLNVLLPGKTIVQLSKSNDDNRFAFTIKDPANGYAVTGYGVWEVSTATLVAQKSTTQLDEVRLDKTGRYLDVKTGLQGAGVIQNRILDIQTGTLVDLTDDAPDYGMGHSDMGRDFTIGADNWSNTLTGRKLSTPHTFYTVINFKNDWTFDVHISLLADDESWALISSDQGTRTTGLYHNEVFQVSTDGSSNVRRYAHHRSVMKDYWDSSFGNISQDGRLVAFTSNWGNSGRRDVFVIDVAGSFDSNNDEILDRWQIEHFGYNFTSDPLAAGSADPDGDGWSNLAEYQAGTDPVNRASSLIIVNEQLTASNFDIQWNSIVGKKYQIQSSSNMVSWADAGSFITATSTSTTWRDSDIPTPTTRRFYRIKVVP